MTYSELKTGEFYLDLKFGKNRGVGWLETENKLKKNKKNKKEISLKY